MGFKNMGPNDINEKIIKFSFKKAKISLNMDDSEDILSNRPG